MKIMTTESSEQQALFRWAEFQSGRYPELQLLYHIPNGGKRSKSEAARFRAEGVKAGVPDLCLPVARCGCHGLYIEMKREDGRVSENQSRWLHDLMKQGYMTGVCYSCEAAMELLIKYLNGKLAGSTFMNYKE